MKQQLAKNPRGFRPTKPVCGFFDSFNIIERRLSSKILPIYNFHTCPSMSLHITVMKYWWQNLFSFVNKLRPGQNGGHYTDDIFKSILWNENVWISLNISLKFVRKVPISNIPTLVQIMAWRRPGDKPSSEPMIVYWRIYASLGLNELIGSTQNNSSRRYPFIFVDSVKANRDEFVIYIPLVDTSIQFNLK